MFLDVFSDNNVTIVTNDKGYIETYIYLYFHRLLGCSEKRQAQRKC